MYIPCQISALFTNSQVRLVFDLPVHDMATIAPELGVRRDRETWSAPAAVGDDHGIQHISFAPRRGRAAVSQRRRRPGNGRNAYGCGRERRHPQSSGSEACERASCPSKAATNVCSGSIQLKMSASDRSRHCERSARARPSKDLKARPITVSFHRCRLSEA